MQLMLRTRQPQLGLRAGRPVAGQSKPSNLLELVKRQYSQGYAERRLSWHP
jgi:hypothetical protein